MPLVGLTVEPVGAPGSSVNGSVSPFGSVAVFVNVKRVPSLTVLFGIAVSTGGLFVPVPLMVRIAALVTACPSGLVTVIVRAPLAAPPATLIFNENFVGLL